jgi:ribosomal protein S27E
MANQEATKEIQADPKKVKRAVLVFYENQILIECPFCGKTLIRTNYERIQKLLHIEGATRAKKCEKCGNLAALTLNTQARKIILGKIGQPETPPSGRN